MKIIVTMIPTDLVKNLFLSSFCPFLQTKNKNLVFSGLVTTHISFIYIYIYIYIASRALLQSHAEVNRLL